MVTERCIFNAQSYFHLQSKRQFPTEFYPSFPPLYHPLQIGDLLRFGWEMRFVKKIPTTDWKLRGEHEEGAEISLQWDSAGLQTPTTWLESGVRRDCREGSLLKREVRSNPIPPAHSGVLLLTEALLKLTLRKKNKTENKKVLHIFHTSRAFISLGKIIKTKREAAKAICQENSAPHGHNWLLFVTLW